MSCCCCRGQQGPRGQRGARGPPGVYAQDVLPFAQRFSVDPNSFIQIDNVLGQVQNFTTQTPSEQSFQVTTPNIFTPTASLIININAAFYLTYTSPPASTVSVTVRGDAGNVYLFALGTAVVGDPNLVAVTLDGEVIVSNTGPLQIELSVGAENPTIAGSLTSELIRYI